MKGDSELTGVPPSERDHSVDANHTHTARSCGQVLKSASDLPGTAARVSGEEGSVITAWDDDGFQCGDTSDHRGEEEQITVSNMSVYAWYGMYAAMLRINRYIVCIFIAPCLYAGE